ncbi:hypothetical protein [Photobacterium piscicola]|nr:hypothetical protein [Photobacterium piscicola]
MSSDTNKKPRHTKRRWIQSTIAGLVTPPGLFARLAWVEMK